MRPLYLFLGILSFLQPYAQEKTGVSLIVLGTAQDGGSPHIGCTKSCCASLFKTPDHSRKVVALGIIDHDAKQSFLFEATPDMPAQLQLLQQQVAGTDNIPNAIFLTHAHIGHYTGLMYLGREALGAKQAPVYAMPKMADFLQTNGPWSQLVTFGNIKLLPLEKQTGIALTKNVEVTPITVPHRDEYSETVGFKIMGPNASVLFIPDIDKWAKWQSSIISQIKEVDYAFLDATFYNGEEINNRDISEIPHPFVIESMELFAALPRSEKSKIHFIHLNHTNPLWDTKSDAYKKVVSEGYRIAQYLEEIKL